MDRGKIIGSEPKLSAAEQSGHEPQQPVRCSPEGFLVKDLWAIPSTHAARLEGLVDFELIVLASIYRDARDLETLSGEGLLLLLRAAVSKDWGLLQGHLQERGLTGGGET